LVQSKTWKDTRDHIPLNSLSNSRKISSHVLKSLKLGFTPYFGEWRYFPIKSFPFNTDSILDRFTVVVVIVVVAAVLVVLVLVDEDLIEFWGLTMSSQDMNDIRNKCQKRQHMLNCGRKFNIMEEDN
jgi:hypothetical protein